MENQNAAKYAFFYLLSLFALIFTALPTGMIIFQMINKFIPDALDIYQGSFSMETLKFAISALIIAAPIYFIVMRQIVMSIRHGALDKDSGVRRWLTYFILFVSSVVSIVWLIMTVNAFLNGDLTIKFMLKALTAISISAIVFTFYLLDIRRDEIPERDPLVRNFFIGALALVSVSFAAALFIVDSPAETRNKRYDNQVLSAFDQISYGLDNYYAENGALPTGLSELAASGKFLAADMITDPVSNEIYQYQPKSEREYELCATFLSSNQDEDRQTAYYGWEWRHEAGYQCFVRSVRVDQNQSTKPLPIMDAG